MHQSFFKFPKLTTPRNSIALQSLLFNFNCNKSFNSLQFNNSIQTISMQVKLAKLKENEAQLHFYGGG